MPFEERVDGLVRNAHRAKLPLATDPDVSDRQALEAVHKLHTIGAMASIHKELLNVDESQPWYGFWCRLGDKGIGRIMRLIAAQLLLSGSTANLNRVMHQVSSCLSKTGQQKWGVPFAFILRDTLCAISSVVDRVAERKDVADARAFFDLPDNASDCDIKKRYRSLSQKFHPDKARAECRRDCATMLQAYLNEARDLLLHSRSIAVQEVLALMDEGMHGGHCAGDSFVVVCEGDRAQKSPQQDVHSQRMESEKSDGTDGMLAWITKIQAARRGLKQAVDRQLVQEIAFKLIRRYEAVFELKGQCFLPDTMLWVSPSDTKTAASLRQGEEVLGIYDDRLTIAHALTHDEDLHTIVELKTREVSLRVTADHRIPVPDSEGDHIGECRAIELRKGDLLLCGQHPTPLVSVSSHRMRTPVVQLEFVPDKPVAAFRPPRWPIATLGQASFIDTDDGF